LFEFLFLFVSAVSAASAHGRFRLIGLAVLAAA
jgi:hypothetical protein